MRVLAVVCLLAASTVLVPDTAATGGQGITVAILDTGVDANHQELAGRVERHTYVNPVVVPNPGGLPVPLPGDVTQNQLDPQGNGTAVASVVAGKTLGSAPQARILDLQVAAHYTNSLLDPDTGRAAQQALDDLLANPGGNGSAGPRVVLLSFASGGLPSSDAAAITAKADALWNAGVLVVAPFDAGAIAQSPHVLAVGDAAATCTADAGKGLLKPDVAAPASNVKVAVAGQPPQPDEAATASRSGQALAAAKVAGVAALMWEARPDLPVAALAAILRGTAHDAGAAGPDGCTGWGTVDAGAAVAAASAWSDPVPPGTPVGRTSPASGLLLGFVALALAGTRRGR